MLLRRAIRLHLALFLCIGVASSWALGQDSPDHRGRKYKPPPETTHIVVQVVKKANGKPIMNAAVVFNPSKDGKDLGNLEVKTDPEGKATIDVIPTGSLVRVQVIANGFATFAEDYQLDDPSKEILISMVRPQEQVSAYQDNTGKASTRKPGVQEPAKPKSPPSPASDSPSAPATTPAPKQ